jgi:LuxR family transcriptional regulator, maltose regulon positive regulatory protein
MSIPILATKLFIPVLKPKAILRTRLIKRLNDGLHTKLTLISAPAGFGKTTLVSEWIADCGLPCACLSLDIGDNDPKRFLTYLVAALQTISPDVGKGVLNMLESHHSPENELILTTLLNDITTISHKFILIFDDYHLIDAKPIDNALTYLLDHLPPQLHLVTSTREDPQLSLARLRARGQLNELRAADLRFTPSEAAEFLNGMMDLNLTGEDIDALEMRTEGWIAGLQLAAISMQGQKNSANFIKSFTGSHHFIMDYLVEEVLNQLPDNLQTFLLHTSILDSLCGSLCDAVLSDKTASGQKTLEYLENANLFLVPLDNERRWYRYHHLFAELLKQRLQQKNIQSIEAKNKNIHELHIRASKWYEANDLLNEALQHALIANDFDRMSDLLELLWPIMDGNYQYSKWLDWVQMIPEELIHIRPVLSTGYAWALLDSGKIEAAEVRLRDAEKWLDKVIDIDNPDEILPDGMVVRDNDQFQNLPATIAIARAYQSQALGDGASTEKHASRALELLPKDNYVDRGKAAALLGLVHWMNGDLESVHQSFTEVMASFQMAGNAVYAMDVAFTLADIRMSQGRLNDALRTYEKSLKIAMEAGDPIPPGTANLYVGLSGICSEWGDLKTAAQHLQTCRDLGEQATVPGLNYRWWVAQARIKEVEGDFESALNSLVEAERQYVRTPVPDVRPFKALKARMWIAQGKVHKAINWVREQNLTVGDEHSYLSEFEHITLARVLIAKYKRDNESQSLIEVNKFLDRLLISADEGRRMLSVLEILILKALNFELQDNTPLALVSLEHALKLAEPEGFVRIFVDEGVPMARLLSKAIAKGETQAYTAMLLTKFKSEELTDEDIDQSYLSTIKSPQPLVEPLSQREIEVLQLIAQGLSNHEICKRLFLALSTVKGHNRNIFGKLQVQRRTEAVVRAQELGLLS